MNNVSGVSGQFPKTRANRQRGFELVDLDEPNTGESVISNVNALNDLHQLVSLAPKAK